jgi:hypothetical protein
VFVHGDQAVPLGTAAWHREIKQKTKAQTCRVTCDQEEFLAAETKNKSRARNAQKTQEQTASSWQRGPNRWSAPGDSRRLTMTATRENKKEQLEK